MAFVIMSTRSAARPRLHTVGPGMLAALGGAVLVLTFAGGIALGFQWRSGATSGEYLDPIAANRSGNAALSDRALAHRVGTLAGRLIRLESEAVRLARRIGIPPTEPASLKAEVGPEQNPERGPIGGPLLTPLDDAPATPAGAADFNTSLKHLSRAMDLLESRLAAVADASSAADLSDMAFPSRRPIPGASITSGFGNRRDPFTGRLARHAGYDLRAAYGTPILASAGGRVTYAGRRGAYGRMVEIDHGNGLVTRYGHASRLLVKRNDVVLPGQPIALVGSTGRSTGPHVHFEVREDGKAVSPGIFLASNGR